MQTYMNLKGNRKVYMGIQKPILNCAFCETKAWQGLAECTCEG